VKINFRPENKSYP